MNIMRKHTRTAWETFASGAIITVMAAGFIWMLFVLVIIPKTENPVFLKDGTEQPERNLRETSRSDHRDMNIHTITKFLTFLLPSRKHRT